ncbi:RdgB/HAM1 family non-canonical purine NTP pyrophosphatase [Pontimonas sp.]|nr:RdgB/HAM1 family non-canonical purine NTP pyrophosphatase [Pontimonas sp.]
MDLIVGTKNAHKVAELQRILALEIPGVIVHPSTEESPVEDGDTFSANALIKARSAYLASGRPAIADDSGLEVDALEGRPGIFSARYAESGLDADNTAKVLREMEGVEQRSAAFVCAAALVHDGGEVVVERRWSGTLADQPAGDGGFGYDPIFVPEGHSVSAAELSAEEKDSLSHRGLAFRALAPSIRALD